ncbi:MAG TPA: hypothetical protein PK668_12525 [Myxococcota bacterium]|nr:hypothetical protein [Myxococcota bacterium]HRY93705.1 hypothetical protein [Myxococcota bacterium]
MGSLVRSAGFLSLALSLAGCAGFNGEIPPLPMAIHLAERPVQQAEATVVVELPEVIDRDEEKDFTPIAPAFAASFQLRFKEYLCMRNTFTKCTAQPEAGAFHVKTRMVVSNYRPANGGFALGFLGGLLLPPLLGMAWSIPVGLGTCDSKIELALLAPSGEELWRETEVWERCASGSLEISLPQFFEIFLPDLSSAAVAAAASSGGRPAAEQGPPGSTKPGAGIIVAVFDVEDASRQFDAQALEQLQGYLATRLTELAGYSVVPREQLRQRLLEQASQSYRPCFEASCQIELGKEVAAQKTLATRILKVGEACVLTSQLYDLKRATTEKAASARVECGAEKLLDGMDQLARQLAAP